MDNNEINLVNKLTDYNNTISRDYNYLWQYTQSSNKFIICLLIFNPFNISKQQIINLDIAKIQNKGNSIVIGSRGVCYYESVDFSDVSYKDFIDFCIKHELVYLIDKK